MIKQEDNFNFIFIIVLSLIFYITLFIIFLIFKIKHFDKCNIQKNRFIKTYTKDEYDKILKETTEIQKNKLFQSKEFIDMMYDKSFNEENWNWQLRERRKNNLDSNLGNSRVSNDNLSEITVDED